MVIFYYFAIGCWLLAVGSFNQGLKSIPFGVLPEAKSQWLEALCCRYFS
jgi:hypothetical protein